MSLTTTPAILLRSHPYSETSRILRFLTAEFGVVAIIARGLRRGDARGRGTIDTFDEGDLTVYFRENRELQTFKDFATTHSRRALAGDLVRFSGASILAELVLRHTAEEEAALLFEAVRSGLDRIEDDPATDPLARILAEGWQIVAALGYEPIVDQCSGCGRSLDHATMGRFDFAAGGVRCAACGREGEGRKIGPVARRQLRALLAGEPPDDLAGGPAQLRLFGDFVTWHVSGGRPLNSVRFLSDLLNA